MNKRMTKREKRNLKKLQKPKKVMMKKTLMKKETTKKKTDIKKKRPHKRKRIIWLNWLSLLAVSDQKSKRCCKKKYILQFNKE